MNGTLDDVAIWDQPLTAAQIAELAASTKTPLDFDAGKVQFTTAATAMLATNDALRKTQLPTGPVDLLFPEDVHVFR